MASIYEVSRIINAIANGLEDECLKCMDENRDVVRDCIQEQLYSGLDGNENSLRPSYSEDSYFQETNGRWHNDPDGYIRWKLEKTPPMVSPELNLPARPVDVPNLFITGAFHDSIFAEVRGRWLHVDTKGFGDGPLIVRKYGDSILSLGSTAREYFITMYLKPWLEKFFSDCGYK